MFTHHHDHCQQAKRETKAETEGWIGNTFYIYAPNYLQERDQNFITKAKLVPSPKQLCLGSLFVLGEAKQIEAK
jgi:hypothetical protein